MYITNTIYFWKQYSKKRNNSFHFSHLNFIQLLFFKSILKRFEEMCKLEKKISSCLFLCLTPFAICLVNIYPCYIMAFTAFYYIGTFVLLSVLNIFFFLESSPKYIFISLERRKRGAEEKHRSAAFQTVQLATKLTTQAWSSHWESNLQPFFPWYIG